MCVPLCKYDWIYLTKFTNTEGAEPSASYKLMNYYGNWNTANCQPWCCRSQECLIEYIYKLPHNNQVVIKCTVFIDMASCKAHKCLKVLATNNREIELEKKNTCEQNRLVTRFIVQSILICTASVTRDNHTDDVSARALFILLYVIEALWTINL